MQPLWQPTSERIANANVTAFIRLVNARCDLAIADYAGLHAFSINDPEAFWQAVWDYCEIIAERPADRVVEDFERMPGARWFPGARLNFARNLLRRDDDAAAVIGLREDGYRSVLSFRQLTDLVSRIAQAMRANGIGVGDCVAGFAPNVPETVAFMLAATSLGAIWSCCGPEFGVGAAVDRIGQVSPKLLWTADGYFYGGQTFGILDKVAAIVDQIPSIEVTVIFSVLTQHAQASVKNAIGFDDFIAPFAAREIEYASLPFDHPVFILFSSGTTGAPKCIVHGAGNALIENLKSQALQFDVKHGDCVYWWSTTGWVVWNLMAFALGRGASIVLYDGSPLYPTTDAILRHTAAERATFIRLTPKYVELLSKSGIEPGCTLDLSSLRTMIVSSSPFGADGYAYIFDSVKRDLHLGSPAGGTDPLGSLVSANPISPVWPGEIQGAALGFNIQVFDDDGVSVVGEAGELVVAQPFPSMPLGFWGEVDDTRYLDTYFRHFPSVWRHGDWAQVNARGGFVIFGRSDATLNAHGIRIGTAELYRQVSEIHDVAESVAVAQEWQGETRIVLFVQLQPGKVLDADITERIRARIRSNLSPRHVPARIIAVQEIPMTSTGKVSEAAVQEAIHGRVVRNRQSLANPHALDHFAPAQLHELMS